MSNRSKKSSVPEAQSALNRFKFEVASELGVPLSEGYNGDLTSRQNGSVGGYMVKKMIEAFCRRKDKTMIMVTHYQEELPACITNFLFLKRN